MREKYISNRDEHVAIFHGFDSTARERKENSQQRMKNMDYFMDNVEHGKYGFVRAWRIWVCVMGNIEHREYGFALWLMKSMET